MTKQPALHPSVPDKLTLQATQHVEITDDLPLTLLPVVKTAARPRKPSKAQEAETPGCSASAVARDTRNQESMAGNEHERTTESRLDSLSERTNSCEPCCPLQVHQALDDDPDELESAPMADLPGNDQVAAELYKPIKDWQIRLLCLHSGSTTMIEVSLYTADLVHMKGVVVHIPPGRNVSITRLCLTRGIM